MRTKLTKLELLYVNLLARGLRGKQIAQEMNIVKKTADDYSQRVKQKAGVRTHFQLGVEAARRGWIEEQPHDQHGRA